jgi:hypothetical protein
MPKDSLESIIKRHARTFLFENSLAYNATDEERQKRLENEITQAIQDVLNLIG